MREAYRVSHEVPRLRLCTPNAGGPGSIPGQGTRSPGSPRHPEGASPTSTPNPLWLPPHLAVKPEPLWRPQDPALPAADSNTPGSPLPQGLCTCQPHCLELPLQISTRLISSAPRVLRLTSPTTRHTGVACSPLLPRPLHSTHTA